MKLEELFDRRHFVLLDGGMGTQLQQRGLAPGALPELAAFTMPETLTRHPEDTLVENSAQLLIRRPRRH